MKKQIQYNTNVSMIKYLFILLILCWSYKGTAQITREKTPDYSLKINRINNIKSYYIIYAQRNDSVFKIVSRKQDNSNNSCKKIEVGKSYLLNLRVIFPLDSIWGFKIMNPLDVSDMVLEEGVTIKIEKSSHYKIYESENLNGLYYDEK
ncbi:hypothetical protein [Bacteroides sp.]